MRGLPVLERAVDDMEDKLEWANLMVVVREKDVDEMKSKDHEFEGLVGLIGEAKKMRAILGALLTRITNEAGREAVGADVVADDGGVDNGDEDVWEECHEGIGELGRQRAVYCEIRCCRIQ